MARSARFTGRPAVGHPGVTVTFQANRVLYLVDQVERKFRGGAFQRAVMSVNEEAAIKVQEGMAQELSRKIDQSRAQVPGERLKVALLDEDNREVSASGFTVLRPSYMDRSPAARYWRQIEMGNVARPATVLFTTDRIKWYAPWSEGGGTGFRPRPPGYKHAFAPTMARGVPVELGPWRPFHFAAGGRKALAGFPFKQRYIAQCKVFGINLSAKDFR